MGIAFDAVELFHLNRAEFADFPQIVPAQIHQHIVLCKLLFVRQQLRLQRPVLRLCFPSGTGPRQGEGVEHAILQLNQGFRGSSGDFHVHAGEVEHIGGGIHGPQNPVGIQQTALKGSAQPVGQDDLKNISLPDMVLCLLHHTAVAVPVEQGGKVPQQPARLLLPGGALLQQRRHVFQLHHCLIVAGFRILQRHIGNEDNLLPQMVKGDHLIKQHQVHILELLTVLGFYIHGGL